MTKLDYQKIDKIKLYLRKNILEDYLTGDEKDILKKRNPLAKKYLLNSNELLRLERSYKIYEERVFTILYGKELIIIKEDIKIIEKNQETELKDYLISQKILIRKQDKIPFNESKEKVTIEEGKISKMISSVEKIKKSFKKTKHEN